MPDRLVAVLEMVRVLLWFLAVLVLLAGLWVGAVAVEMARWAWRRRGRS